MEVFKTGIILLYFVCLLGCMAGGFRKCPKMCKCDYRQSIVKCENHGRDLQSIPKLYNVSELQFNGNYLPNVTKATFANINKRHLKTLSMNNDSIFHIDQNSFDTFPVLKALSLGMNDLSSQSLQSLFSSLSKIASLENLHLNTLSLKDLPEDFFANMAGSKVRVLQMRNNSNDVIDTRMFTYFKELNVLDLKFNFISSLHVSEQLGKLYVLNLVHNSLTTMPEFCSPNGTSQLPSLSSLFMQFNKLQSITRQDFRCLKTLVNLNLSNNRFHVLENDMLFHLHKLQFLELKWNMDNVLKVQPNAFRSNSMKILSFQNQLDVKYTFTSLGETFMHTPNLLNLSLESMSFVGMTTDETRTLFKPLVNIEALFLFNCQLMSVPYIFNNKPNIRVLQLGRNKIATLEYSSFKGLPKLESLLLAHNALAYIHEGSLPLDQESVKKVDLSNNPFLCTCQQMWFVNLLKKMQKKMVKYPKQYVCSLPASKSSVLLSNLSFTYRECHPFPPYVWAAMIGGPLLLVTVVIATIVYRNRWNIKHYIYLLRKRRQYERLPDNDYIYDAFIAHSQSDYDWIVEVLIPKLETELNYKLCVHDRNFRAGLYVVDNIIQKQEESRNIILVVSNEFAKSDWCRFEMKLAQKRCIENDNQVLIVILLERLLARNVPKTMKVLLNTTTYIEWTDDDIGRQLFWDRLQDALRRPM